MIELRNIEKAFGEKQLFNGYNAAIPEASLTIISGDSGCGKTTLLNMLGYLELPDKGDIIIDGKNLRDIKQQVYYRDYVGFLFQNFALMENKTVKQNLEIIKPANRTDVTIEEALNRVGLSDKLNTKVYKLSGGEQQRAALARLIIKRCKIILADEPTGSLDDRNAQIVMEQLHELAKEGKCVVMVTHNKKYLEEADNVLFLN